jgi:predicted cupin superfamily sugar epimerase
MQEKKYWIEKLNLESHPEGGYFKESYRAKENYNFENFKGLRNISTGIYFLLDSKSFSAFHRIKSDMWHFYEGDPLRVHIINQNGTYSYQDLGRDLDSGMKLQFVVPANCWFASEVKEGGSYSLVGCTVSPGFNFHDFELADKNLATQFPEYRKIINRLTH